MEMLFKFCVLLCSISFLVLSWIWWEKSGLWREINLKIKSLDSQWFFNRPLEMVIQNEDDRETVRSQNQERNESASRLMEMNLIKQQNSDPLPRRSYFNTTTLNGICEGKDSSRCSPDFMALDNRIRVSRLQRQQSEFLQTAPAYNITACMIHKSMSTVLQAIMCYLYDEHAFLSAGRVFSRECTKNRFCFHKNEYSDIFKARKSLATQTNRTTEAKELLMAIVREPVDRFLSAFVDKCIRKPTSKNYCNSCRANMTCFVISEYKRIMKQVIGGKLIRSFEDRHFFPQAWRCNFNTHLKSYKLIYYSARPSESDDFVGQLNELLESQGVPFASREFISDQLKQGRTVHSTIESEARQFLERRLRSSSFLMEFIVRMSYTDFKHFEYRLPEIEFE
ncbi:hypothetical protein M3Y98_00520200 [Aphelenchoides besseyi]|nr:hypothetical protein M3Y98_00520200 [Aphelenchoides besseyi]KAI6207939.1 hypothetical protein M3Y96_00061800 [Aphelenchoides besseyi]